MFCCRTISGSYEAVMATVINAFSNNRGQPLNEHKLLALKEILSAIRNEPFMNMDKAIDVIMEFESHDFAVEPIGLDLIMDLESLSESLPEND